MSQEDIDIYNALQYNEVKEYWYYIVPTSVRRSGQMRISNKKFNSLKNQYNKLKTMGNSILKQEFYFGIDNFNTHGEEGLLCIGIDNNGMPDDEFEGTFENLTNYLKGNYMTDEMVEDGDILTKVDLNLADEDTEENRQAVIALFKERLPFIELEIN